MRRAAYWVTHNMQYQPADYDTWMRKGSGNKIKRQMQIVENAGELLATNKIHAMIVTGPPGLGKTHVVAKVLRASGIDPMPLNPVSNAGLIEALYNADDRVLLGDDMEQFITGSTIGTLKKALDPQPRNRQIVYQSKSQSKLGTGDPPFDGGPFIFRGRICLLMNRSLHRSEQWPDRLYPHLKALASRVQVFNICDDLEVIWEYTCYLAICEGLLQRQGYSLPVANMALAYLTETMRMADDASPRRLEQIAQTIKLQPLTWREVMDMRLPPRAQSKSGYIPAIPQIVPRRCDRRPDKRPASRWMRDKSVRCMSGAAGGGDLVDGVHRGRPTTQMPCCVARTTTYPPSRR